MKPLPLFLVLLSLTFSGCKYSLTDQPQPAHKGASALVTQDDAKRILGGEVRIVSDRNGTSDSVPGAQESSCEYVGADRSSLMVVMLTASNEDAARKAFDETRSGLGSFEKIEEVSGIGDEAFWSRGPSARKLIVRKKAVVFQIEARRDTEPEPSVDEMKRVATRVTSQL